ncbi:DUF3810 domain-containing protein [Flavobacterium frigidarium]|uniref:DUF3810 domain-containing protein n=1 Tax=Flavobacterium frigidarium TaxID=99286 RepID=UPI0004792DE8|nr:DUF3810 domain-containing protein [Flavobacterium frigidarium]
MKSKYFLAFFLVFQILALKILAHFPEFVEQYYSNGLFPILSVFSRTVFSIFPFSVGDVAYIALVVLIIRWFWSNRKSWKTAWRDHFLSMVNCISIFYFLFHFLWALNYYRQPLSEKMQIETEYSDEDLVHFTEKLIVKTNAIHRQLVLNDISKVAVQNSTESIYKQTLNGYKKIANRYPYFQFQELSTKNSLLRVPLSYMGFSGYLNPFTNEAQLNNLVPKYNLPSTVTHEMAHQIGYASESECNFIGFLSAINNDDLYFKYSGYSFALKYCLNSLKLKDEQAFEKIIPKVHKGILLNYQESQDFWEQYQSPIEIAFHLFYDNFLKLNQQKDGIDSYSKFVDLMINYYKTEEL